MDWPPPQLLVLLGILIGVAVNANDCIYKVVIGKQLITVVDSLECFCMGNEIDCVNRKMTQMPQLSNMTFTGYTSLDLSRNVITVIPAGSLPYNLTELDVSYNPIAAIEDTTFDGLTSTLQTLFFSLAKFTRIPDAFLHLNVLKSLTVRDTNIQDWNEAAMNNIGQSLQILDLDNVSLTTWPPWIHNFSHLTELIIVGNSISSIPDNAFDKVSNSLATLSLYSNSLTSVPKALSNLLALKDLYMQENKINDVTWLPQGSKLNTLWLNNNQISNATLLSKTLRPYADSLSQLNVKMNSLTAIPNLDFCSQIGNLDFSYNAISDAMSGSAPVNVAFIDWSHNVLPAIPSFISTLQRVSTIPLPWNSITQIQGTDFPASAVTVDLGYNLLTDLTDTSFPQNSKITSLVIVHNPIVRISRQAFANLSKLTALSLQSPYLTRLPLSLSSLTSLTILDMAGNTALVCTCTEKSVQNLVYRLGPDSIAGDCGKTSIFVFFALLSPECP